MALGLRLGLTRILKRVEAAGSSISPVTVLNGQTANLTTPPGSWTLNTLFFRSGGNLPIGISVEFDSWNKLASAAGDGTWEDDINGGPFNPPISGAFSITNNSGQSITFWDFPLHRLL